MCLWVWLWGQGGGGRRWGVSGQLSLQLFHTHDLAACGDVGGTPSMVGGAPHLLRKMGGLEEKNM